LLGILRLKTNNSNLHITTGSGNSVTTAYFSSAGNVGIGNVSPGSRLQVDTGAIGTKGVIVKGFSGQTANLQEWQISSGSARSFITSDGKLTVLQASDAAQGGVEEIVARFGTKDFWSGNDAGLITVGFTDIAGAYNSSSARWVFIF